MRRRAWLAISFLAAPSLADDAVNKHVQDNCIDPILGQIGVAAHTAADPNGFATPDLLMPGLETMSPHARRAVDYAKTKLIDPLTESAEVTAAKAARALGSADHDASAPVVAEDAFDFPNRMAANMTQMIHVMMNSKEALSAPGDPLPGENLPPGMRKKVAPVATSKDFAYRKDSISLVHGSGAPRAGIGGRKLKPFKREGLNGF